MAWVLRSARFYEELCIALLRVNPEAGITLRNRLAQTPGRGFTRYMPLGVNGVDLALWKVAPAARVLADQAVPWLEW